MIETVLELRKATADGKVKVFVELRDVNYSGSHGKHCTHSGHDPESSSLIKQFV